MCQLFCYCYTCTTFNIQTLFIKLIQSHFYLGTWSKGGSAPVLLSTVVTALAKTKKAPFGVERRQSGDDILAKGTPKVLQSKIKTQQSQSQPIHQPQNSQKKTSPKPRSGQSPSHARKTNTLLDAFRPRSKSDAASKKNNTIIVQMKNSIQVCINYLLVNYFTTKQFIHNKVFKH